MNIPRFSDDEIEQQFRAFMDSLDATPAPYETLILDGHLHRYDIYGEKPNNQLGAYTLHTDGLPAGYVQDWKKGTKATWTFDTKRSLTQEQREYFNSPAYKAEQQAKEEQRKKETEALQAEAADRARVFSETLPHAPENHPYLQAKRVYPYGALLNQDALAIPLRDILGNIKALQWILNDGTKRFMQGAKITGHFWSIGLDTIAPNDKDTVILIGEGFATMAKVYELTGKPSVAAISCNNLHEVAKAIKGKFPHSVIIAIADNDHITNLNHGFNPGLDAAQQLVKNHIARDLVAPEFTQDNDGSDWDDFALQHGDDYTARILNDKITWASLSDKEKLEINTRKSLSNIIHNLDPTIQLPPQEFIGGLFPRRFVSLLVAPPGTGKTIFMQKFVSDLSIGGSVFDGFAEDEPPRKCLILAGEAGYELLIRRGASMKWPINPDNVKVLDQYEAEMNNIPVMLDDPEGWKNVLRLVDMYTPDIVFFDTFSSFHEKDENKATEMKPLIKNMSTLARDNNIAVVPVHHSRKRLAKERSLSLNQDDVIGSSIINRLVGLIIGIEPMKDDERLLLVRPLKSWFSTFMPFTYTLKEGLYGGTVVQTDLAPASVNSSKIAVWNYLMANFAIGEWFSTSQIVLSEIEGNVFDWQLRRILADFVKSGKLQRRGVKKSLEFSLVNP